MPDAHALCFCVAVAFAVVVAARAKAGRVGRLWDVLALIGAYIGVLRMARRAGDV